MSKKNIHRSGKKTNNKGTTLNLGDFQEQSAMSNSSSGGQHGHIAIRNNALSLAMDMVRSERARTDANLMADFDHVMKGNCFYFKEMVCMKKDTGSFAQLKEELASAFVESPASPAAGSLTLASGSSSAEPPLRLATAVASHNSSNNSVDVENNNSSSKSRGGAEDVNVTAAAASSSMMSRHDSSSIISRSSNDGSSLGPTTTFSLQSTMSSSSLKDAQAAQSEWTGEVASPEEEGGKDAVKAIQWSKHLLIENPTTSPHFNELVACVAEYFDLEVYATRLNYYPDATSWKPFHHDSHAYGGKKLREDFTAGISLGSTRDLAFLHPGSQRQFSFPQENGDVFAFTSEVNSRFQHGVPRVTGGAGKVGPRLSIIAWGRRRSINERNGGKVSLTSMLVPAGATGAPSGACSSPSPAVITSQAVLAVQNMAEDVQVHRGGKHVRDQIIAAAQDLVGVRVGGGGAGSANATLLPSQRRPTTGGAKVELTKTSLEKMEQLQVEEEEEGNPPQLQRQSVELGGGGEEAGSCCKKEKKEKKKRSRLQ